MTPSTTKGTDKNPLLCASWTLVASGKIRRKTQGSRGARGTRGFRPQATRRIIYWGRRRKGKKKRPWPSSKALSFYFLKKPEKRASFASCAEGTERSTEPGRVFFVRLVFRVSATAPNAYIEEGERSLSAPDPRHMPFPLAPLQRVPNHSHFFLPGRIVRVGPSAPRPPPTLFALARLDPFSTGVLRQKVRPFSAEIP